MTLQQLTYLVTVADCGNITEAAEKLFISQPSLSAAIHNLEKEMGVTAFTRSNKGVTVTREGEELLSFARMLLEQADNMKEHFGNGERRTPKFSVSCQHYSFAVNAFVDLIKEYDAEQYSFIIRETQTGEIIEDVAQRKSEIGLLYLNDFNRTALQKLLPFSTLALTTLKDRRGVFALIGKDEDRSQSLRRPSVRSKLQQASAEQKQPAAKKKDLEL